MINNNNDNVKLYLNFKLKHSVGTLLKLYVIMKYSICYLTRKEVGEKNKVKKLGLFLFDKLVIHTFKY